MFFWHKCWNLFVLVFMQISFKWNRFDISQYYYYYGSTLDTFALYDGREADIRQKPHKKDNKKKTITWMNGMIFMLICGIQRRRAQWKCSGKRPPWANQMGITAVCSKRMRTKSLFVIFIAVAVKNASKVNRSQALGWGACLAPAKWATCFVFVLMLRQYNGPLWQINIVSHLFWC